MECGSTVAYQQGAVKRVFVSLFYDALNRERLYNLIF